jgi:hypothetical protein
MRMELLMVIIASLVGSMGVAIYCVSLLWQFLKEVPAIQTPEHLERFKKEVARQMYGAPACVVLLAVAILAFTGGVLTENMPWSDIKYVLPPAIVFLVVGYVGRDIEQRAKTIPVSEELRTERDRIVQVWRRKVFPDW